VRRPAEAGGFAMREDDPRHDRVDRQGGEDRDPESGGWEDGDGHAEGPERLDQVKAGDRLEITRTEEVAVRVEKVEKKK